MHALILIINLLINPEVPHVVKPIDGQVVIVVPDDGPSIDGACNRKQTDLCRRSCGLSAGVLMACETRWEDQPDGSQQQVLACRCVAWNSPLLVEVESSPELICSR